MFGSAKYLAAMSASRQAQIRSECVHRAVFRQVIRASRPDVEEVRWSGGKSILVVNGETSIPPVTRQ